jgi:hypothetical protein
VAAGCPKPRAAKVADIDPSDGDESFRKTVETIPGPRRELTG